MATNWLQNGYRMAIKWLSEPLCECSLRFFCLHFASMPPASLCAYVSLCVFSESLCASLRASFQVVPFFSFSPFFFTFFSLLFLAPCVSATSLCVSVRLSACIWCGVSASLHPFFRLLRLYAALCVSLRLSASLFIYLLFAFFLLFYRLFFCVPCVSALSRSAPLSGATM